jgi:protease I
MTPKGKKIGILIESDFYEKEIFYYEHRFAEEGIEVHWLSRLWGQPGLTFTGHEFKAPFYCGESFEGMSDEELRSYDAIIVPSAFVSDRLRYSETLGKPAPAVEFIARAFAEPGILKGIICHGMWLVSPMPELVRGRPVVGHPNLYSDIVNMGAIYTDQDVVVDGDLVTARTGGHCHQFANKIIELLGQAANGQAAAFNHVALSCADPAATERFYTGYFGFRRARVIPLGDTQIVFLRNGSVLLELFKSEGESPVVEIHGDGPHYPGVRHLAFKVGSVDAKLAEMGNAAHVTLGPLDFDAFIPGWRTVWVADPDGNIVEISQGYVDQDNPPALGA